MPGRKNCHEQVWEALTKVVTSIKHISACQDLPRRSLCRQHARSRLPRWWSMSETALLVGFIALCRAPQTCQVVYAHIQPHKQVCLRLIGSFQTLLQHTHVGESDKIAALHTLRHMNCASASL